MSFMCSFPLAGFPIRQLSPQIKAEIYYSEEKAGAPFCNGTFKCTRARRSGKPMNRDCRADGLCSPNK